MMYSQDYWVNADPEALSIGTGSISPGNIAENLIEWPQPLCPTNICRGHGLLIDPIRLICPVDDGGGVEHQSARACWEELVVSQGQIP